MSSGLTALSRNDYKRARSLFLQAKSFKPNSEEVNDALTQVDEAIRLSRIDDLRKKALAAEDDEDWHQSLASYQAVLDIDKSIRFAIQGKERSTQRSQLEKHINHYIKQPTLLESDHHLKQAIELIKQGETIESRGPRLNDQLKRLDKLVQLAQATVPVTLESDGVTEVVVYKVGKFGHFYTRELNLRPGTYTIVGARDGYKDVRQRITVKTGQGPVRVVVKCGEKI
jgi:tetratricopeptide (TPR) repeat protein